MYRLISATPEPVCAQGAHCVGREAIPFELVTEVPWNSTSITARYDPLEKLPILRLENGDSISESSYILEHLELKHPAPPLLATDGERRRPSPSQSLAWSQRQRRKIEGGVREMARLLGERQWPWVIGSAWATSP